jgi:methylglutaconyl-CoA hydratase
VTEPTRFELRDGVATITLDQPDNRNALSVPLVNALGDRLAAAAEDRDCRVVVLTNTGPAFCAGADLKGGGAGAGEIPRHTLVGVLTAILDHPKPVIGRIAGHCMGGGVGLAAACDISVASSEARLGFTEVRIGVAPAIISVVCLPKLRAGDALDLFLSGERISAERAAEVGLINRAVPPADLDQAVASVVGALLQGGPGALTAAKQLVRRVPALARAEAFAWTEQLSGELFRSAEAAEGMAAFREKRLPSWVPAGEGGAS